MDIAKRHVREILELFREFRSLLVVKLSCNIVNKYSCRLYLKLNVVSSRHKRALSHESNEQISN